MKILYLKDIYYFKIKQCNNKNTSSIYKYITNTIEYKKYIYSMNGIYNNIDIIPGDSQSSLVFLTAMTYFSLNDSITEYYYSDAFILKHLKFMNFLIFIFLKVGIQLGYFIFIQRTTDSKK